MLPIVDKPPSSIWWKRRAFRHHRHSDHSGPHQSVIEDHFDRSRELEEKLAAPGKEKMLEGIALGISTFGHTLYLYCQKQSLGLRPCPLSMAKPFTGDMTPLW